jgi:hypothetical protein
VYAQNIVKRMTDNPSFPNPAPTLVAVTAAIDELRAAEVSAFTDMVRDGSRWGGALCGHLRGNKGSSFETGLPAQVRVDRCSKVSRAMASAARSLP